MVDYVENIRGLAISAHKPRIIPKPVQNAVKIEREAGRYKRRRSESSRHRRPYASGVDTVKFIATQAGEQTVAHQVHAGPIFFDQVADNSQFEW